MTGARHIDEVFRDVLPDDARLHGEACRGFAVDGLSPAIVLLPATIDDLSRCLSAAARAGLAALPAGRATNLSLGRVPERYDVAVCTRHLNRIVAHEAADMTVTVQAGATLAEVNGLLAGAGQRLPLDPPLAGEATVGGIVATDSSGPLRLVHGKVRDLLIGVSVVLADGRVVRGGGRVVKNVAGYDLMKLFTGSYGTLGVIAEATFKVRPRPQSAILCVLPASTLEDAANVGRELCNSMLVPSFVEAASASLAGTFGAPGQPACLVGFEGTEAETSSQAERLQEQARCTERRISVAREVTDTMLATLRDFPARRADGAEEVGCRISVLPTRLPDVLARVCREARQTGVDPTVLAHVGTGVAVLRAGAPARNDAGVADFLNRARGVARTAGGWAVCDRLPTAMKAVVEPWDADPPGIALMRGLKKTLDPGHVLAPGRFVGGI